MMGLSYLVLLLAVLLFWNWRFIGLDRWTGLGRERRLCQWTKTADAQEDAPAAWRCAACGVQAGTTDGREPTRCLRPNRDFG